MSEPPRSAITAPATPATSVTSGFGGRAATKSPHGRSRSDRKISGTNEPGDGPPLQADGIVDTEGDIDLETRDYYTEQWSTFVADPEVDPVVIRWAFTTAGSPVVDGEEVARTAARTLADPRGWSLGGAIRFKQVESTEEADLVVMLAEAALIADYAEECVSWQSGVPDASCTVGALVIINDLRWRDGALGDRIAIDVFRVHEINHETGHWLGQGHFSCLGGTGAVNQQQFRSLGGCEANAWPLPWEKAMVAERYVSWLTAGS